MRRLAAVLFLLVAAPAFAQQDEVSLLGGYTTAGDIAKKTVGIQQLEAGASFAWSATAGHFFGDHMGLEASWAQQGTAMRIGTRAGEADLFDMKLRTLQGSFLYQLGSGGARFKPFLMAGLGGTFLSAPDLQGETKFSWSVGAGLRWFPSGHLGARIHARYTPTLLNDSSSEVCDPFGFCQGSLHQFELRGGLAFRF